MRSRRHDALSSPGRATLGDGLVQPTLYEQVGTVNTESIRGGEPLHDHQGPGHRSESGSGSGIPSGSSHRPTSSAKQDVTCMKRSFPQLLSTSSFYWRLDATVAPHPLAGVPSEGGVSIRDLGQRPR